MAGAVDKSKLNKCIVGVCSGSQMRRQSNGEGREAEVESDATLLALRILVETCSTRHSAQGFSEARLPAVNVTQHAHVKVQYNVLCRRHYRRNKLLQCLIICQSKKIRHGVITKM